MDQNKIKSKIEKIKESGVFFINTWTMVILFLMQEPQLMKSP